MVASPYHLKGADEPGKHLPYHIGKARTHVHKVTFSRDKCLKEL